MAGSNGAPRGIENARPRRPGLLAEIVAQIQQIRALLECVWPAALEAAQQPFESRTWMAALRVICGRDGGDFARTRRLGRNRLERLIRGEVTRGGAKRPCFRITGKLFAAPDDPAGVLAHRRGAVERVHLLLEDWAEAKQRLAETEARMTGVLDELRLTDLVTSIVGLSAGGAAAILAETGDPTRFPTARAVVEHAGLAPREKKSGAFTGRARLTGAGRPGLRLAAWRGVWGTHPVYAARYRHLTTRETNPLTPARAQAVIAAMPGRRQPRAPTEPLDTKRLTLMSGRCLPQPVRAAHTPSAKTIRTVTPDRTTSLMNHRLTVILPIS
ncbi:IS110 family transposase [Nocardia uniformis]|uniref:IS110 family transposase n=1 Tax=Nocardia uniformis TaxID=53432 RepID=A0A849C9C4_9NOCA|nr:transposase [Nocardia uniformis]NNH75254.1 IS110 family transposase [Nocardia uniformis]